MGIVVCCLRQGVDPISGERGTGMKKIVSFLFLLFIPNLLVFFSSFFSMAQEDTCFSVSESEVVFLLDASKSMKSDGDGGATDVIRQILYSLPSDTKAGLVIYNADILYKGELGSKPEDMDYVLASLEYAGYSNAGLGLQQAISLFSGEEGTERHIIMVSDGEIDMKDGEESEASKKEFASGMKQAGSKGIQMHIVVVGDIPEEDRDIPDAAGAAGSEIYTVGVDGDFADIAGNILFGHFNFPRKKVGTMEGSSGNFHIELPVSGASRAKVLLIGKSEIESINAGYTAGSGRIMKGKRFAVVDLNKPSDSMDITFDLKEASAVEAYLIAEYEAGLEIGISYRSEQAQDGGKGEDITYTHYADMEIRLLNRGGGNGNLWAEDYYEGHPVSYTVNGEEYQGTVEDGAIRHSFLADGLNSVEVWVGTDNFYEIFGEVPAEKVKIELPPDPVTEVDYRPLWYILGILLFVLAVILVIWLRKSKAGVIYIAHSNDGKNTERYESKSCQYTGKFNLYVVQTQSGRDIAPQTIRLFGRKGGKITLEWILNSCGIRLGNIGAGDIAFYPGPEKAVVIMDQSEQCTVMRGMEILKKGIGYPVYYNEKLTVTLEDGITELEIHYKNLKPGEREGGARWETQ